MSNNPIRYITALIISIHFSACQSEDNQIDESCTYSGLLETFVTPEGEAFYIYENGGLYAPTVDGCNLIDTYFEPGFHDENYILDMGKVFIKVGNGNQLPVKNSFTDHIEADQFNDLFLLSLDDTESFWTNFTVQSPAVPSVEGYVSLSKCILDGTCDFIDNRIELAPDPINSSNQCLKFSALAPTAEMVTSKSSITSTLSYFVLQSDFWFEAKYLVESGTPFSIADFESSYFLQEPGPRIIVKDGMLAVENKFGAKLTYQNTSSRQIPMNEWFTVKLHLKYSNANDGVIALWIDDELVLDTSGITLPTALSVQNILEVGVTATSDGCVMYMDDLRISDVGF